MLRLEFIHSIIDSPEYENFLLSSDLCGLHHVNTEFGQNQHYRRDCYVDPCPLAESVVRDDRVWTHLDTVISNSNTAFKTIDFEKAMLRNK